MDLNPPRRTPHLATIADWIEGRVTETESEQLAEAMEHDPQLRDEVTWVRAFLRLAKDLPLVDPPALLRQKLDQEFRRWTGALPIAPVRELFAELVFDSRRDRLQLSSRSGHTADDLVHLVWRTAMAELVVEARTTEGEVRLDGQVLVQNPTTSPVFEATATGPGFAVCAVDGDGYGRFRIRVPATVRQLVLTNDEFSLVASLDLLDRAAQ